jgi:hypothetical protein
MCHGVPGPLRVVPLTGASRLAPSAGARGRSTRDIPSISRSGPAPRISCTPGPRLFNGSEDRDPAPASPAANSSTVRLEASKASRRREARAAAGPSPGGHPGSARRAVIPDMPWDDLAHLAWIGLLAAVALSLVCNATVVALLGISALVQGLGRLVRGRSGR